MNQKILSLKILVVSILIKGVSFPFVLSMANAHNIKKTCRQTINNYQLETVEGKNQQQFLREKILTPSGELREEFVSQEGLMLFAEKYFKQEEDLSIVFHQVSNILPKPLFDHLKWKLFYGSAKFYQKLKSENKDPIIFVDAFKDMEGYVLWTARYFNRNMEKAFLNAKTLVKMEVFEQLNWKIFYGLLSNFEHFKSLSFSRMGKIHEELKGLGGYLLFSLNMTRGDMKKAYMNTKAVLNEDLMRQLEWPYFDGTTKEFDLLKEYIKTKGKEGFINKFKEASGLSAFVNQYHWFTNQKDGTRVKKFPYKYKENKAINNVSVILGSHFERLNWKNILLVDNKRIQLDIILRGVLFNSKGVIREEFINEFKGIEGYLTFSERYFNGDMFSAFEYVKAHLKSRFDRLRWKSQFFGMADSFRNLRSKILNEDQEIKKRFRRDRGLLLFSNLYFNNDKQLAYTSISRILDSSIFTQLRWRNPFSLEYLKPLRSILFYDRGRVFKKWKTMDGYLQLAIEYRPNRNMRSLFDEVIILGGKELIRQLKWKNFYGYIEEFQNLQKILNDDLSGFLEKFSEINGQMLFAEQYYEKDIEKSFRNVFALLDKKHFDKLKWKGFDGITSDELFFIYDLIFDKNGSVKEDFIKEFEGIEGQMLFSEKYSDVSMFRSYQNVSLLLGDENFWRLDWKKLQGSIDELKILIENLLDKDGSIRMEYRGRDGYLLFCESYFPDKDMFGVYKNAFSLVGKKQFQQAKWIAFKGLPDEFKVLRNRLILEDGRLNNSYSFTDGMVRLSTKSFHWNLQRTYENTYAAIPPELFNQLMWKKFYGSVSELHKFENIIFESQGIVRKEFIDEFKEMEGLAMLSNRLKLDMTITARNVSSLLQGTGDYIHLGWKSFEGFKSDFDQAKAFFFLPDGSLKPNVLQNYRENDGMNRFSEQFGWPIKKTFYNISAILPSDLFEKLNWTFIPHTPKRDNEKIKFANLIFTEEGQVRESFIDNYQEMDGLSLLASEFFEGNMLNTFVNVSALMKYFKSDFKRLNWRKFYGDVQEYEALKSLTLNEDGSLKEEFVNEFKGMEGYASFSSNYFIYSSDSKKLESGPTEGEKSLYKNYMFRVFINISAVTNPFFDRMEWRVFQGSVEDFKTFKSRLLNPDGSVKNEFKGMDQMARFADLYAGGNMTVMHKNASSLLGGAKRVSELLGWKVFYGQSSQFYSLIEDFEEHYPDGWIGSQGQERIADKIFQGDQNKLKKNVSSIRGWFFGDERMRKEGGVGTKHQQAYSVFIRNEKFNELNWQ